jgi:transketolase
VEDEFGQSGSPEELLTAYGLTAEHIVDLSKKVVKRKRS